MKFRKKPVVIEAWQVPAPSNDATSAMPIWLGKAIVDRNVHPLLSGGVDIKTLEGTMRADVGDWIIQGVKGELYPCKPDIFEATYEAVQP